MVCRLIPNSRRARGSSVTVCLHKKLAPYAPSECPSSSCREVPQEKKAPTYCAESVDGVCLQVTRPRRANSAHFAKEGSPSSGPALPLLGLNNQVCVLCPRPAPRSPSQRCHYAIWGEPGALTTDSCKHTFSGSASQLGPVSPLENFLTLESEAQTSRSFSVPRGQATQQSAPCCPGLIHQGPTARRRAVHAPQAAFWPQHGSELRVPSARGHKGTSV